MTEEYNLEFREAQERRTLAFIIPYFRDTIFLNNNALEETQEWFEIAIEELLEHESIHLAILNTEGEKETRAYDKIHKNVDRIFW